MRQGIKLGQVIALIISVFFSSCSIIDPAEDIPAYLHIDQYTLTTNFDQGTASHNITDVWVYLDQEIVGVYELPATIPILGQGSNKITIRPGIKINGIASTRIYYPFYKAGEITLDLVPAKVDTLQPATVYNTNVIFKYIEGFEDPGVPFASTPTSDTGMLKTNAPELVFEGTSSAAIILDKVRPYFAAVSNNGYKLPQGAIPVYLELNFRNDTPFVVGLISNALGGTTKLEILVLNPTSTWKKVYINLGPTINRQSQVIDFNLYLSAGLETGKEKGEIYLDNLKLLHY